MGDGYLHGKDGIHERAAPLDRRKLGRNDRRQWIVAPHTNAHNNPPEDDRRYDRDPGSISSNRLAKCPRQDDHKLDAIHLLAAELVGQPAEEGLTDDSAGSGRKLDRRADTRRGDTSGVVGQTDHVDDEVGAEQIVSICEESGAGDNDRPDMRGPNAGIVDLLEGGLAAILTRVHLKAVRVIPLAEHRHQLRHFLR